MLLCLDQLGGGSDGQCQLQQVPPPPPTPLAFIFCLETTCLPSIDAALLASTVSNISHNNLWRSGVRSHWTRLNGGYCVKKKTTTVLLIVISLCGHLEKLSMWLHAIHMTGYLFTVANAESCIFGPRVFWHGVAEWISVLKSSLQLEGDSRRSSRDDLIAGRIIIPSLLPSSEAGISTWSAKDEHEASGKWIIAVHQPVFGITSYYSSKTTNFRCQANMMTPVIM